MRFTKCGPVNTIWIYFSVKMSRIIITDTESTPFGRIPVKSNVSENHKLDRAFQESTPFKNLRHLEKTETGFNIYTEPNPCLNAVNASILMDFPKRCGFFPCCDYLLHFKLNP